ncbi:serine/threonine-protein kinase [Streptomyces sp. NPDC048290]|uniref:serine/threonine-protein kinase n=1 Tax=Streptomyces sp. NPDC048290 TaxID=3155811 RepID=UPI00343A8DE5
MRQRSDVFQPLQADDPAQVAGYRLVARLGAGGMGRVYLSHTPGGRPLALKVVRPELADDPDFRRRFRREITAARRVRGAYTAELVDADADGVPPWLATLYVPGPALSEAVRDRGPLSVSAVLWLTAGIAEALQAIHGAGIVHRDLKPSNVLLAADGPRVIDFGISHAADVTSHTAAGATIGTPQYMAPEQAVGGGTTTATDVFALGQTAAYAALGRPLYGDGPAATVLYRIVHSRPDLTGLPEELRPLIARCLAADPAERATLAEILAWCKERLGADARPEGWRESVGPEVTVPGAPAPEPVTEARDAPARTLPHSAPHLPPVAVTAPAPERTRITRRTWLTLTAVLAVLVLGLAWTVRDGFGRADGDGPSAASPAASSAASSGASPAAGGTADPAEGEPPPGKDAVQGAPTASPTPSPLAYPLMEVDEERSVSLSGPYQREDRQGDLRFHCAEIGCALESDTSRIVQMVGASGSTLDECRLITGGSGARTGSHGLAAAAAGSEFCVRHRDGDIALLVVQTKSTALWDTPGMSFLTFDMTVWRDAAES